MLDLIEQIDRLSLRDTKTLSQKALKATEEVGELAKAVLPYEGANCTNHRVPSGDKIIEECADIMLVAYSIMKVMGCSLADIESAIRRKANKWETLLDNEAATDLEKLDFEVHITVKEVEDLESFKSVCAEIGVKPIILDLYGTQTIKDVMTSSNFCGTTRGGLEYAKEIGQRLRDKGFDVLREKVETVPWHPAAQIKPIREPGYFEAHFAFHAPTDQLKQFCLDRNIHLSRNTMKVGQNSKVMGTYRVDAAQTTPARFLAEVDDIAAVAKSKGHHIDKIPHTEYALHDTNETHDSAWITGKSYKRSIV